jgi:AraC family transcriptional regulator, exoenzyme S synthesis regulatory protein ExsA
MSTNKFLITVSHLTGTSIGSDSIPMVWSINDLSTVYSADAYLTYGCALTTDKIDRAAFLSIIQSQLYGEYVVIDIETDLLPHFLLLLKKDWLEEYSLIDKENIDTALSKVVDTWLSSTSLVRLRHKVFVAYYLEETFKQVSVQSHFLDLIFRLLTTIYIEPNTRSKIRFKEDDILRVGDAIIADLHSPIPTISQMALMAHMSVSKFKKLFQETFKKSPHQYIQDHKMAYAKELLKSGEYNFTQIAYKIGYNHTSGFSRLYKKAHGKD